jgi:phage terminase large subunit GpA-like protein
MADGAARIRKAFADGIRPSEALSISQWADKYRQLPKKGAAEPGDWRTDRTPHLREILDCMGDEHPATEVVAMLGSQMGKSEVILNRVGFTIHWAPYPMLLVQPDIERAENFSKQRIAPMIDATPVLRALVADPKSRDSGNTLRLKEYPGGTLAIVGANAPAGLASMPIRIVLFDEVDRFAASAGTEGSPIDLAIKRTTTFGDRKKIGYFSTPTILNASAIWKRWELSDKRHRLVPCPQCGHEQELQWEGLKWTTGKPDTVYYVCEENGCVIHDSDKATMLPTARWEATAESDIPGFTASSLYLPLGWDSWATLVREYETAWKSGDPDEMQTFVNTRLCRLFDVEADYSPPDTGWEERAEEWKHAVPHDVSILTAGVDVQDDRLEIEVVGWGEGEESWSVAYKVIPGDLSGTAIWADLDAYLVTRWQHETRGPLPLAAVCIDSGGHHTDAVHTFCAERAGRRVWSIKGTGGREPIWPRRITKGGSQKWRYYRVGVDTCKDRVVPRLSIKANDDGTFPPGYCHVPAGRGVQWYAQMRAEKKVVTFSKGRAVVEWRAIARRNEALDCRVYAYAALHSLLAAGHILKRPERPVDNPAIRSDVAVTPAPVRPAQRDSYASRYRNGGRD